MRKWFWILIFLYMQITGAYLWKEVQEYKDPYLKVVCIKEMEFPKAVGEVKKYEAWQTLDGVKLSLSDPMKPEYHIYTDNYEKVGETLLNNKNVLSVSYRRFQKWDIVCIKVGLYMIFCIGIVGIMKVWIAYTVPISKKRRLQLANLSLFDLLVRCNVGFWITSFMAFIIIVFFQTVKILNSVPLLNCGIIGLTFSLIGTVIEIYILNC